MLSAWSDIWFINPSGKCEYLRDRTFRHAISGFVLVGRGASFHVFRESIHDCNLVGCLPVDVEKAVSPVLDVPVGDFSRSRSSELILTTEH
jgi:hypothetical protein